MSFQRCRRIPRSPRSRVGPRGPRLWSVRITTRQDGTSPPRVLRRTGGRWIQTVKGDGKVAGGLHRRAEFEWRLAATKVDQEKLARTPWRKLFASQHGPYRRVFATDVRRSEQPLTFADGTRATLCLDVGEIRAGRHRIGVSEVEVELEHGDPSRLFELASTL